MKQSFLKKRAHVNIILFNAVLVLPGVLFLAVPSNSEAEIVTHSVKHVFSMDNVQGGFGGSTYLQDPTIICGITNSCPSEAQPFEDSGTTLYPVDSEFGYYYADFVGGAQKERDDDYAEGWVGDVVSNGEVVGLMVSNAKTDTFKVKAQFGTWCAGLGGNMIKCSTEHFTVLEHIKSCYETIPYKYADPETGEQSPLYNPATGEPMLDGSTCEEGVLDNNLYLVEEGIITTTPLTMGDDGYPDLIPNESDVRKDIAVSRDYSITKKDDGKPLYRFGSMVKRPNDIRLYARLQLPQEWKDNPNTNYQVIRAELHIEHLITNNPNDQVRPEDMENEGATGRMPGYELAGDRWISTRDCYEGDGDFIGQGTVFKNPAFAAKLGEKETDPVPYSEDLLEGFTNAWYTTTDRDPFGDYFVDGNYVSGPRWRLKANKFGQDLPGLEMPSIDCLPTPYTSQYVKYKVGDTTTTVLDLLDFEGENSPLLWSQGWTSPNGVNELAYNDDGSVKTDADGNQLTVNGLPLTEDFDLAVYIKGDRKPTAIYNATLFIEYEGEGPGTEPPAGEEEYDLALDSFKVPRRALGGTTKNLSVYITNNGPDVAEGTLVLEANLTSLDTIDETISRTIAPIAPGETVKIKVPWEVPFYDNESISWTATINAEGDINTTNNSGTGTSLVRMP
ncbi:MULTISPECIES: DUF11 domain-containing protein [Desulfosediminicola]|uniref:COG1470 family protein n=1 Tax=Desulfosediminicola TaxID=2886823 RepID=UPI0010ABE933|nr:DUF11 domain-containing protein [Desulfosediminicola ganghwensis]